MVAAAMQYMKPHPGTMVLLGVVFVLTWGAGNNSRFFAKHHSTFDMVLLAIIALVKTQSWKESLKLSLYPVWYRTLLTGMEIYLVIPGVLGESGSSVFELPLSHQLFTLGVGCLKKNIWHNDMHSSKSDVRQRTVLLCGSTITCNTCNCPVVECQIASNSGSRRIPVDNNRITWHI